MATAKHKMNTRIFDGDNIEDDIRGVFFDVLTRGGIDTNDIGALAKLRHNQFDGVLLQVFDTLYKPNGSLPDNKRSIIPFDDIDTLRRFVDVYISLCTLTDNDSTLQGFSFLTGIDQQTLWRWSNDELNPERSYLVKRITETRQGMIESKLSDNPIGATALANNSKSLGMMWSRNTAQLQNTKAVYIIPAEKSRPGLPNETRGQITDTETGDGIE
jgi:hypothetical protein